MPTELTLTENQMQQMIAHAQAALPNEACGLLGGKDGRVQAVVVLLAGQEGNDVVQLAFAEVDPLELPLHHLHDLGSHPVAGEHIADVRRSLCCGVRFRLRR